jgi:hypothetical protein
MSQRRWFIAGSREFMQVVGSGREPVRTVIAAAERATRKIRIRPALDRLASKIALDGRS